MENSVIDISVIMPTYNRCEILKKTLSYFCELEKNNFSWEIIVVNNNSSDNTKLVVEGYVAKIPVCHVLEKKQGKNFAVNRGIHAAKGHVLVFVDDDICPEPLWLKEVWSSCLRHPMVKLFGGKVIPSFPNSTSKWITESSFSSFVFGVHMPAQNEGPYEFGRSPVGANCWIRRDVFEAGYFFDENIGPKGEGRLSGSELEFFTRLQQKGISPHYVPSSIVHHRIQKDQTSIKYLLKRSYASGRGFIYIYGFDSQSPMIFGAPRYLYRQILDSILFSLRFVFKFDKKSLFEEFMTISHRIGCIRQCHIKEKRNG